jgi:lipopolysaccharide export LptBFGC system permease protein LptF
MPPYFPKSSAEITLRELREWIRQEEDFPNSKGFRRNLLQYHGRGSAEPAAPLVFALFGLAVITRPRLGRAHLVCIALLAAFGYYVVLYEGQSLIRYRVVPPIIAAWLANIATVLAAAAIATVVPARVRMSE